MTRPRLARLPHRLAAVSATTLACALTLGVVTSGPANAATLPASLAMAHHKPVHSGSAGVSQTAGQAASTQADLVGEYSSLAGALINLYATNSGQTIEQYLARQKLLLAQPSLTAGTGDPSSTPTGLPTTSPSINPSAMPTDLALPGASGTPSPGTGTSATTVTLPTTLALGTASDLGASAAGATPLAATSFADLNEQLKAAGTTIDMSGYKSLDDLAATVLAKSNTVDGAVTLASAKWMQSMANLRTPKVRMPQVGGLAMPSLPKDSLVFGLFANKALTSLVNSNPGLFSSASAAGLGSQQAKQAWQATLAQEFNATQTDLSSLLPDACTGGMLAVMASGNASSAKKVSGTTGCSSACVTGGLYLNSQLSGMFDPSSATTSQNPFSSLWSSSTLQGLQGWQQKQLLQQNPQLSSQLLNDNNPKSSASCKASSTASSNAMGASLPGIFGQLRTK